MRLDGVRLSWVTCCEPSIPHIAPPLWLQSISWHNPETIDSHRRIGKDNHPVQHNQPVRHSCHLTIPTIAKRLLCVDLKSPRINSFWWGKGWVKNNLVELALRFGLDLVDPIDQNHRNSRLFRGFCE